MVCTEKLWLFYLKNRILNAKIVNILSINAYMAEKMNKSASFYLILAVFRLEFEAFCVFLRSGLL
jgi:hypothetical protein